MTQDELAAIRERANAATAGPWQIIRETDEYGRALNSWQVDALYPSAELADAEFVAQSRADIPALLHEIESHKGALRYQTDVNIALREDAHRLRQELKVTNAEAERWHALAIERHHNLEEVAAANKRLVDEVKQLRARDETARYADRLGDFAKIKELQAENERLRAENERLRETLANRDSILRRLISVHRSAAGYDLLDEEITPLVEESVRLLGR